MRKIDGYESYITSQYTVKVWVCFYRIHYLNPIKWSCEAIFKSLSTHDTIIEFTNITKYEETRWYWKWNYCYHVLNVIVNSFWLLMEMNLSSHKPHTASSLYSVYSCWGYVETDTFYWVRRGSHAGRHVTMVVFQYYLIISCSDVLV